MVKSRTKRKVTEGRIWDRQLLVWTDWNGDYRYGGVFHDLFGHTAEMKMTSPPMAGHHHHVHLFPVNELQNFLGRVAYGSVPDIERAPLQIILTNFIQPLPRLFLFPLVNLIHKRAIELPIPGFMIGQLVDDGRRARVPRSDISPLTM